MSPVTLGKKILGHILIGNHMLGEVYSMSEERSRKGLGDTNLGRSLNT